MLTPGYAGFRQDGDIMLNNDRIRLMTKLALYEGKEGKEDIALSKYYKSDYVRYQIIKSIICTTIAYVLILALFILYKSEYIIAKAVTLNYRLIGMYALGIYIIIVSVYAFITGVVYSLKYDRSRKKLGRYYKLLKRLNKMYNEETSES